MHHRHTAVLFLACATLLAGCASSDGWPRRRGPAFADAFPDARELVATSNPSGVRKRLADVRLPASREHHDRLLGLLRGEATIDAPHLMLLVEAVALPEGPPGSLTFIDGRMHTWPARGTGEFAPIADALLVAGADKLVGLDRRWFGELLARSHDDATLRLYSDRFLAQLDDGSEAALRELLAGMKGSPAMLPLVANVWLPDGRLDGARGWSTVSLPPFDDERVALVQALARRARSVDQQTLVAAVDAMTFDGARREVVQALAPLSKPVDGATAQAVVAGFSFDDSKVSTLATLSRSGGLRLREAELVRLAEDCAFDDSRLRIVRELAGVVDGPVHGETAAALLRSFAFDSTRLQALRTMAPRWRALPPKDRLHLVSAFGFSSSQQEATALLDGA